MAIKKLDVQNKPDSSRQFVGKAWLNTFTKDGEEKTFINVSLDREIDELTIKNGVEVLQLWPNKKREGKKDADYRVSTCLALKK